MNNGAGTGYASLIFDPMSGNISYYTAGSLSAPGFTATIMNSTINNGSINGAIVKNLPASSAAGDAVRHDEVYGIVCVVGSGTCNTAVVTLPVSSIPAGSCSAAVSETLPFTSAAPVFVVTPTTDPSLYGAAGLTIHAYPGVTNTVNVKVCNPTSAALTPAALTVNVRELP